MVVNYVKNLVLEKFVTPAISRFYKDQKEKTLNHTMYTVFPSCFLTNIFIYIVIRVDKNKKKLKQNASDKIEEIEAIITDNDSDNDELLEQIADVVKVDYLFRKKVFILTVSYVFNTVACMYNKKKKVDFLIISNVSSFISMLITYILIVNTPNLPRINFDTRDITKLPGLYLLLTVTFLSTYIVKNKISKI